MSKRPNILFIFTDQQRFDAVGLNNPKIRTPAMDSIGRSGVNFMQACCNAPVCMPSRHSLFSGRFPSTLGNTCNGIEMPQDVSIFPHYLKKAGYFTANIGKLHFLNHSNRDHSQPHPNYGFDLIVNSDEPGCYDDAYIEWVGKKDPDAVELCRCSSPPICEGPRRELEPRETDTPYAFRGPEDLSHSAFVAERSIQAIQEVPEGQPWFVCAGFYAPHCPLNPPKHLWESYNPQDMPLPTWDGAFDPGKEGTGLLGHSESEWRKIVAAYYALTSHVDDQVRCMLDYLTDEGLLENTLIVFTSDHGEYLGDHGRIQKGPPGHDCIMRVPLMISWPGKVVTGQTCDAPVELVDLAPTFLDMAGIPIPVEIQGKSLRPLLEGADTWSRLSCYQEYIKDEKEWQTLRMGPRTYAECSDGVKILMNRDRDSHELENFFNDPAEQESLKLLQAELRIRTPRNRRRPRPMTGAY